MSERFVMTDEVVQVEEKLVKTWVSGTGAEATFRDNSIGWYVTLGRSGASVYLGTERPGLQAGDRVRLTLERA